MKSFEDLRVFREAIALMVEVYRVTDAFPRHELYGLTQQVRRSAGSVVAHIAEGQGRLTYGEWRQLLSQGRGSLFETEAHLIAAHELGYLVDERFTPIRERARTVGCLLAGLIRYVQRREAQIRSSKHPQGPGHGPRGTKHVRFNASTDRAPR
jgi:four helix bundle protein